MEKIKVLMGFVKSHWDVLVFVMMVGIAVQKIETLQEAAAAIDQLQPQVMKSDLQRNQQEIAELRKTSEANHDLLLRIDGRLELQDDKISHIKEGVDKLEARTK